MRTAIQKQHFTLTCGAESKTVGAAVAVGATAQTGVNQPAPDRPGMEDNAVVFRQRFREMGIVVAGLPVITFVDSEHALVQAVGLNTVGRSPAVTMGQACRATELDLGFEAKDLTHTEVQESGGLSRSQAWVLKHARDDIAIDGLAIDSGCCLVCHPGASPSRAWQSSAL